MIQTVCLSLWLSDMKEPYSWTSKASKRKYIHEPHNLIDFNAINDLRKKNHCPSECQSELMFSDLHAKWTELINTSCRQ